jgi:predicted ATPase
MFVFLEGATGAGKSTVTTRLQQMGYSVHHENFIQLCQCNPDLPPHSLLMQTKWMAELIAALQRHVAMYQRDPASIKHGVVFLDRSPLTPAIYAARDASLDAQCKSYLLQLSLQLFASFRSTLLLCSADAYAVSLRRSHRLMQVKCIAV